MVSKRGVLHNISVTIDGVEHKGTYYVQGSHVHVQCEAGAKVADVWGSPVIVIAKSLLAEIMRERGK